MATQSNLSDEMSALSNQVGNIILDLCGGTGSWSKPYAEAGFDVRVITLPEFDVTDIFIDLGTLVFYNQVGGENMEISLRNVYGIFAAPPCTMFSRARTTAKTPRDFESAMLPVRACLDIIHQTQYASPYTLKFWAIENPAGHLQRFLGRPPFKFHPYDFGDRHSKETFIWGLFNEPKKTPVQLNQMELLASRNNTRKLPPIPDDYERDTNMKSVQIRRSITPQGFARAFYKANSGLSQQDTPRPLAKKKSSKIATTNQSP